MRIYLDEDMDAKKLASMLRLSGHEVLETSKAGNKGRSDEEQLRYASDLKMAVMTANVKHFTELHQSWRQRKIRHAGILIVHKLNDFRDSYALVVAAVTNLESSGLKIANQLHNLSFWR
ncbi:MAG: hypothetical protein FJ319_08650 [SAR202 cluster bacterium]|nr:hypothetical protein [SAR202 cluster bacterium]